MIVCILTIRPVVGIGMVHIFSFIILLGETARSPWLNFLAISLNVMQFQTNYTNTVENYIDKYKTGMYSYG